MAQHSASLSYTEKKMKQDKFLADGFKGHCLYVFNSRETWPMPYATETLTLKYLSPEWLQKSNDPECPNLINQKNV